MNRVVFSSLSVEWQTPVAVYDALNSEFAFNFDPCPINAKFNGIAVDWSGRRVYCNPPYGRHVWRWLDKACDTDIAVYLLPAKTDTKWFHDYCLAAHEIRFIKGRLKFGGARHNAPFPSMIVIFKPCG